MYLLVDCYVWGTGLVGDERVLLLHICHIDNIDVSFGRLLCLGNRVSG